MKKMILVLVLCLMAPCLFAQGQPPQAQIQNKQLKLKIYLPDAKIGYYRGVRFEWGGIISDLEFAGHHLYRPWFATVDPEQRDFVYKDTGIAVGTNTGVSGPAEEFQAPVGYATAKPGETFLKVGVGLLRKGNEDRYFFGTRFEIVDSGKWAVRKTPQSITFEQTLGGPNSEYGYVYTKTIRLVGDSSQIVFEHHLKNTGKLPITTKVYNHNFLTIDNLGVGPAYSVAVPYDIKPASSARPPSDGKAATPAQETFIRIEGKKAVYVAALKGEDHATSGLQGFSSDAKDYDFTIANSDAHIQVRMVGDHPLANAMLWSIRTVMAVEPFIDVQADPGKEFSWNYTYTYSTDSGK